MTFFKPFLFSLFFFFLIDGYSQDTRGGDQDNNASRSKNKIGRTLLDDSTKIIYGMNTTSYILSSQLLDGDTNFIQVDSSLNNFEKLRLFNIRNFIKTNCKNIYYKMNFLFCFYLKYLYFLMFIIYVLKGYIKPKR